MGICIVGKAYLCRSRDIDGSQDRIHSSRSEGTGYREASLLRVLEEFV